jgi:hypothetical protein
MFETNFDNCFGPLHCVCRTKIPWQGQRESLPIDQSQSKEIGVPSPAMGARNQVGIGLSYRSASLCSLATQFQTRFLELIPCPIVGLKFPTRLWFIKATVNKLKHR